ncbi:hypothetical protein [Plastoroseomonas arctica]|uniref:Uncharacterized protein n=1 Tax=Plastoroseomonas arctica TaxID=1509237 RepID=A0AAF1K086_9PROT|nr:hypothetical protein [Plastoroseomonas arctica]MBR0657550.1 hypothetical protein [Plastoroseomonas arctica]
MRSTLMTIGATALLAAGMTTGFAAQSRAQSGAFALQIQFYEAPRILGEPQRYDDPKPREVEPRDWERRRGDREARDQARIEEAARREAQRIEEEREERRAWRRAQRNDGRGGDERFEELRERYRRE